MAREDWPRDDRTRDRRSANDARARRDPGFGPGDYRGGRGVDVVGIPLLAGMPSALGAAALAGMGTPQDGGRPHRREEEMRRGYGPYGWAGSGSDGRRAGADSRGVLDRAADEVSSWFGDDEAARRREMDAQTDHRGRGPKGWTRPDERIEDEVCHRLTEDPMVDASDVSVTVAAGEVTLNGHVADRQQKRRAEDCAEAVAGVRHVQNNLRLTGSGAEAGSRRIL